MQQYFDIKKEHKTALLFFQVGDFYELFFDDAKNASKFLGIALTKRGNINGEPIPLCGVPVHALDHYLVKLVKGGFQVVICDQLEEAVPGKVVKRGITQVLTPGTLTDAKLLNEKSASYILFFVPNIDSWSLVFIELLTGYVFCTNIDAQDINLSAKTLEAELFRFFPDEIVIQSKDKRYLSYFKQHGFVVSFCDDTEIHNHEWVNEKLKKLKTPAQFSENFSLIYSYFQKNQPDALNHLQDFYTYKSDDFLILDAATQKNLEIISNNQDGSTRNSLFYLMDKATTAMGSRMIKKWLLRPLVKLESINQRLKTVELFVNEISLKEKIILLLKEVADLERVVGRIALNKAQLYDYIHLKNALSVLPELKSVLFNYQEITFIKLVLQKITDFQKLHDLLEASLNSDLSQSNKIIKDGFDCNLDRIRELVNQSHKKILELEESEQQSTNITSLKIRFNQVFGYYLEITKPNLHLVPERYKRIQTLSNRERFTTAELKILENDIEKARREIIYVEKELFDNVKNEVSHFISDLKKSAYALAHLDALIGFSEVAYENGYVCPKFGETQPSPSVILSERSESKDATAGIARKIFIEDGRHPIIEKTVKCFIPNSTNLNLENSTLIITGPNMGGKSTYLRQVALISLMAQCGSFVPAKNVQLFLVDRIFTRIGAGDNLAQGKSTFLVEMEETATICKQATEKSLVILDEVGRGTSTYDGLALAQSVVEYIHKNIKCFCLFATHYHELTNLEKKFNGISSYYAASKKTENGILFLHKIIKGTTDGSFGIEVAKLASLPDEVILRAEQILKELQN